MVCQKKSDLITNPRIDVMISVTEKLKNWKSMSRRFRRKLNLSKKIGEDLSVKMLKTNSLPLGTMH